MTDSFRPTQGAYDPIPWEDTDIRRRKLFEQYDQSFMGKFERLEPGRETLWNRDTSSIQAYERSIQPTRRRRINFLMKWV